MQRGHCTQGNRLYDLYQQKSLDLVVADAEKRLAISIASCAEWLSIARGVEQLKAEYDRARGDYIEHVVDCHACEWDQLATSYLDAMEHPIPAVKAAAVMTR
jgi:hypothetical protein